MKEFVLQHHEHLNLLFRFQHQDTLDYILWIWYPEMSNHQNSDIKTWNYIVCVWHTIINTKIILQNNCGFGISTCEFVIILNFSIRTWNYILWVFIFWHWNNIYSSIRALNYIRILDLNNLSVYLRACQSGGHRLISPLRLLLKGN